MWCSHTWRNFLSKKQKFDNFDHFRPDDPLKGFWNPRKKSYRPVNFTCTTSISTSKESFWYLSVPMIRFLFYFSQDTGTLLHRILLFGRSIRNGFKFIRCLIVNFFRDNIIYNISISLTQLNLLGTLWVDSLWRQLHFFNVVNVFNWWFPRPPVPPYKQTKNIYIYLKAVGVRLRPLGIIFLCRNFE